MLIRKKLSRTYTFDWQHSSYCHYQTKSKTQKFGHVPWSNPNWNDTIVHHHANVRCGYTWRRSIGIFYKKEIKNRFINLISKERLEYQRILSEYHQAQLFFALIGNIPLNALVYINLNCVAMVQKKSSSSIACCC